MSYTKNAAAFGKLVGICAGYEGKYNPARQNLSITAIRSLSTRAEEANFSVIVARQNWVAATGKRKADFHELNKLLKRLRGEVKNMITDPSTKKLLIHSINKAKAFNKTVNTDPPADLAEGTAVKIKRTTGMDFATRLAAFEALVNGLAANPDYLPSAPDLTIVALQTKLDGLKARTAEINNDFSALTEARNQRRQIFAHPDNGLYATAARIRNAIKAIFGNPSDELRTVQSVGPIG